MIQLNNASKLKNIYIKEFISILDFKNFKNDNPQYIVHDIKIIPVNDNHPFKYKIFLIYQEIKNNDI